MQIVIDIEDSSYNDLRYAKQYNPRFLSDYEKIILSGTPLPKGHGRLIDADELEEYKEIMNTISGEIEYAVRMDDIRSMSTIIEADKGK